MKIDRIPLGDGAPLVLIAGLNVIETEKDTLAVARMVREIAERHEMPLVFKASFDKANRSSFRSYRGPGLDEGLRIPCREAQISQVLLNLIANAADAVQDLSERWIRIEVSRNADAVEIAVTDSGGGIPDEIRARVMQPFFTTKPAGQGTGFGLSISRAFAEAHAGTLTIDVASPHTRFVVTLPARR